MDPLTADRLEENRKFAGVVPDRKLKKKLAARELRRETRRQQMEAPKRKKRVKVSQLVLPVDAEFTLKAALVVKKTKAKKIAAARGSGKRPGRGG